jgi:hypothetical protein
MSWIAITEAKVIAKLSGPEIAAMKTAALQAAQANPLTEIIEQVTLEIRGYVANCTRNKLGDGATIPDELLGAAVSRIRFELATRLPVASLLTEDRRSANANALTLLRDVAACRFSIVQPETPDEDQAGGPAVQTVSTTTRRYGRDKLSGL